MVNRDGLAVPVVSVQSMSGVRPMLDPTAVPTAAQVTHNQTVQVTNPQDIQNQGIIRFQFYQNNLLNNETFIMKVTFYNLTFSDCSCILSWTTNSSTNRSNPYQVRFFSASSRAFFR